MAINVKKLRGYYHGQKNNAKVHGIGFNLTFDQWLAWWHKSGKLSLRGNKKGNYVMGRINDTGPYELGNIKCITVTENQHDAWLGRKNGKRPSGKIYNG